MRSFQMLSAGTPLFTETGKSAWCGMCAQLNRDCVEHRIAYQNVDGTGVRARADVLRELNQAEHRYHNAKNVLDSCAIVEAATDASVADIGTVVTICIAGKQPRTFEIGDYGSDDPKANPPVVSYSSRMVLPLLGHAVGDETSIILADRSRKEVEILDIRMPNEPVTLQAAA